MSERIERVRRTAFNRNPNRYVSMAFLEGKTIYIVAPGGRVEAVIRGYAPDTALRLDAERWENRGIGWVDLGPPAQRDLDWKAIKGGEPE